MSVVKINAIEVPEGAGPMLEQRFAQRLGEVENMAGFEGFELLRPTGGEKRYFVYTRWATEEDFRAWVESSAFKRGHAGDSGAEGHPGGPGGHPGGDAGGHPGGGSGGHPGGSGGRPPVGTGADLLEFEVVMSAGPGDGTDQD